MDDRETTELDAGIRVLVVDDEADVRRLLEIRLRRAGVVVDVAVDGDDALVRVVEQRPDVVVCDLLMPNCDGFGVLIGLARLLGSAAPPVIILSDMADYASITRALQAGAADFVSKPFSPGEVVERVMVTAARLGLPTFDGTGS